MTLTETLIATVAVGLLLLITALAASWIRSELKHHQVRQLLTTLDEALSAYHEATGHWPLDAIAAEDPFGHGPQGRAKHRTASGRLTWPQTGGQTNGEADGDAERVLAALAAIPASRAVLERIPEVLRVRPNAGHREPTDQAGAAVQDAWGHRLRCLTAASPSEADRQAVAANGGRPIFVSAGADGQFGPNDPAAAADNILLLPSPNG